MKLTTSSIFDFQTIANSKAAQEIRSYFDYSNRFVDEIVRAFRNRFTFEDNFQGQQVVVELVHNVEAKVKISRQQILGVLPLLVSSSTDALTSLVSSVNQQGQLVLMPQFKLASSTKHNVTLFVLFPNEV